MKKTILLAALFVATITAFAQTTTTFGIKAGVNFSKLTYSGGGFSVSSQSLTGFHIGGVVDVGINDNFSFQPGLLFSTKGGKSESDGDAGKTTLNYLEVPINFIYKVPAGDGKVFFGAGPYIGYGLSGKDTETIDGTKTSSDVNFGSTEDDVKNPDFGVNFLAGYELKQGLTINVGYGLGLANLANGGTDVGKIKNQLFSVSLGYFFK